MTLLSTISNESINDNLKKRFQNGEIYVSVCGRGEESSADHMVDVYRPRLDLRQPVQR